MRDSITVLQAQTTVTGSGAGSWIDTGNGTPFINYYADILVNGVIGNPNVIFLVQTSPDQAAIFLRAVDELGPVNGLTERVIAFQSQYRYFRLAWLWGGLEPSLGSLNSSSLSAQSFNSSSSGGGMSLSFVSELCASISG